MGNEFEAILNSLLKGVDSPKSVENLDKYKAILSTPGGQRIIKELFRDGGEQLRRAAKEAKAGNLDAIKSMLGGVMSSKDGEEIARDIMAVNKDE